MGLRRQLRDPAAITVAALSAGAAWAVGVRPTAAGALGLTVLTVKGLTGLALARPDETMAARPDETIATPVALPAVAAEAAGVTEGSDGRLFYREGDFWRIGSGEVVFSLRDSKGLRYLHRLLSHPGQEFHALHLAQEAEPSGAPGQGAGLPEGTFISGDNSLPVLDERAKAEYRERLRYLEDELEEGEALNDEGRVYRAELEIDALKREMLKAIGMGGRDRRTGGQAERAANNVTRAIQSAIDRIAEYDASLAHHLNSTVRRGKFCRYDPGPDKAPAWRL